MNSAVLLTSLIYMITSLVIAQFINDAHFQSTAVLLLPRR